MTTPGSGGAAGASRAAPSSVFESTRHRGVCGRSGAEGREGRVVNTRRRPARTTDAGIRNVLANVFLRPFLANLVVGSRTPELSNGARPSLRSSLSFSTQWDREGGDDAMIPPTPLPARVIEAVRSIQADLELLQNASSDEARGEAARARIRATLNMLIEQASTEARKGTRPDWVSWVLRELGSQLLEKIVGVLDRWLYKQTVANGDREVYRHFVGRGAARLTGVRQALAAYPCQAHQREPQLRVTSGGGAQGTKPLASPRPRSRTQSSPGPPHRLGVGVRASRRRARNLPPGSESAARAVEGEAA